MKSFVLVLALFLHQNALGDVLPMQDSLVCPTQTNKGMGYTCCLESQLQCETLMNQKFMASVLARSLDVVSSYMNAEFPYGNVPNCHWNTFSFLKNQTQKEQALSETVLWNWSMENAQEVSEAEAQAGDVVFFIFRGEIKEDILVNNTPKWVWRPFESFEHSAILIGQDRIYQKENVGTQVFSLSGLEQARKIYEEAYLKSNRRTRGQMRLLYYRPHSTVSN